MMETERLNMGGGPVDELLIERVNNEKVPVTRAHQRKDRNKEYR